MNDLVSCTPHDVPSRDGIPRRVNASLGPIDHRQKRDSLVLHKLENVFERVLAIEATPLARPVVGVAIVCNALPIAPRQFRSIAHADAALMRGADQMHTAKRFLGEPAKILALVLVEKQHAASAIEQLIGGDNAGESAASDHDLG